MKERPILFSAPMVRAILEGRKTQTRRILTYLHNGPKGDGKRHPPPEYVTRWCSNNNVGPEWHGEGPSPNGGSRGCGWTTCPYGMTGDRLWVRETWTSGYQNGCWGTICAADEAFVQGTRHHEKGPHFHAKEIGDHIRWRPSIFMPRWASRIDLEITEVRVQRLQEITASDAIAEGVEKLGEFPNITPWRNYKVKQPAGARNFSIPQASFMSLWETINGTESYKSNPWVWAITFKRVQK